MKNRTRILLALAIVCALGAQVQTGFKLVVGPVPQDFELTTRTPDAIKRGGLPVAGVTTDFYGRPRDPQHPSMGAFEWTGPAGGGDVIEWFGSQPADETGHGVRGSGSIKASLFRNAVGTGILTDIEIHVAAGDPLCRVKIYVYGAGGSLQQPGPLLLSAGEIVGPVTGYNRITGLQLPVIRDGWYWLAWECSRDLDVYHGTTEGFRYAEKAYSAAAPDPFPPASGAAVNTSMRAKVQVLVRRP